MNEPPNYEPPDALETIKEQTHKLMDLERWNEAISLLYQALAVAPHDAEVITNLSIAHLKIGDLKTAVALSAQAVIAEPTSASAHAIRSGILIKNGRPDLAYKSAQEAMRLDPQGTDSLDALFWSQLSLNRRFEARNTAYKMLELAPDLALSHKNMAHSAIRFGQWKDAERHCRAALKLDPLSYDAMNNLGLALENQQRRREAIECYLEAVKLDPSKEKPRANLGSAARVYVNSPPVAANALAKLLKSIGTRLLILVIIAANWKLVGPDLTSLVRRNSTVIILIGFLAAVSLALMAMRYVTVRRQRILSLPENIRALMKLNSGSKKDLPKA